MKRSECKKIVGTKQSQERQLDKDEKIKSSVPLGEREWPLFSLAVARLRVDGGLLIGDPAGDRAEAKCQQHVIEECARRMHAKNARITGFVERASVVEYGKRERVEEWRFC